MAGELRVNVARIREQHVAAFCSRCKQEGRCPTGTLLYALDEQDRTWRGLAGRADSLLSYIRHRLMPRERWEFREGGVSEHEADAMIAELRSASEGRP